MRIWAFVLVLTVLLAARAEAQAEGERTPREAQGESDVERARRLFAEGVELIDAERWAEAAARFRQVMPIRSTPQVKYNLALALRGLGQLADAAELLREASRSRSAPSALREDAEDMLESIEPRIGRLTIRIAGDDDRASVMLDGRAVGLERIGYPIAVDPGDHEVVLRRGGETLSSEAVHLREGEARDVTLEVVTSRAVARTTTLPAPQLDGEMGLPQEHNQVQRAESGPVVEQWWFWTAIGAVAVVLATIVVAVAATN